MLRSCTVFSVIVMLLRLIWLSEGRACQMSGVRVIDKPHMELENLLMRDSFFVR